MVRNYSYWRKSIYECSTLKNPEAMFNNLRARYTIKPKKTTSLPKYRFKRTEIRSPKIAFQKDSSDIHSKKVIKESTNEPKRLLVVSAECKLLARGVEAIQ